jgi:hypothetical protein
VRIAMNVPDDVAERLAQEDNVSAFVTQAVRARIRRELTRSMMEASGLRVTDAGVAAMRRRWIENQQRMTPEVLAAGREMNDQMRRRG